MIEINTILQNSFKIDNKSKALKSFFNKQIDNDIIMKNNFKVIIKIILVN
jgi:hypothetical protein